MPVKLEKKLKLFAYTVKHDSGEAAGQLQGYTADEVREKLEHDYPQADLSGKPHKMLSGETVPVELAPQNAGKLLNVTITVEEIK